MGPGSMDKFGKTSTDQPRPGTAPVSGHGRRDPRKPSTSPSVLHSIIGPMDGMAQKVFRQALGAGNCGDPHATRPAVIPMGEELRRIQRARDGWETMRTSEHCAVVCRY